MTKKDQNNSQSLENLYEENQEAAEVFDISQPKKKLVWPWVVLSIIVLLLFIISAILIGFAVFL